MIDSGYTDHMCNNPNIFEEFDSNFTSRIMIIKRDYVMVQGRGIVAVFTKSSIKYINDVLFVSDLNQNLLCIGQMLEKKKFSAFWRHVLQDI